MLFSFKEQWTSYACSMCKEEWSRRYYPETKYTEAEAKVHFAEQGCPVCRNQYDDS